MKGLHLGDFDYLLSRGYTEELLLQEVVCSLGEGNHCLGKVEFYTPNPVIAFTATSMGGEVAGIQTACREKHEYRWFAAKSKPFLPILYGSGADFDLLYRTQEMVLVEGIFDRIAMKRMLEGQAVFARLSKGVSGQLAVILRRYAKRVWLAFDNDLAGEKGVELAQKKLEGVELVRLSFPGKDPSALLGKYGLIRATAVIKRRMELSAL